MSNARTHISNQLNRAWRERTNLSIQRSNSQGRLERVRLALQEVRGVITEAVSARRNLENLDCTNARRWRGINQKKVENYYENCQADGDGYNKDLVQLQSTLRDTEARLLAEITSIDRSINNIDNMIRSLNSQLSSIPIG